MAFIEKITHPSQPIIATLDGKVTIEAATGRVLVKDEAGDNRVSMSKEVPEAVSKPGYDVLEALAE